MNDPSSFSRFRSLFDAALQDYEKQAGTKLVDHPLAKEFETCDTIESITAVFQEQARVLRKVRDNGMVMKSLNCAVNILYTLSTSTVLGESIGRAERACGMACYLHVHEAIKTPCCDLLNQVIRSSSPIFRVDIL